MDENNDGEIDTWSDWQEVKERYDYIEGFAKQIKRIPAALDLSDLPPGYGFGFEIRLENTTQNTSKPILDRITLTFDTPTSGLTKTGTSLPAPVRDRAAWMDEAKFGLFIHWGAYAVAGAEASWPIMIPSLAPAMFGTQVSISEKDYVKLPAQFNPVEYDPAEWVRIAQEAAIPFC